MLASIGKFSASTEMVNAIVAIIFTRKDLDSHWYNMEGL